MAMSPFMTFANREVAELTFCDFASGSPVLYIDWANVTSTSLTGETVYARGGMGAPKRVGFGGNREGTLSIETQMNCAKLYAIVTGGELSTTAEFLKRTVVKAAAGALTLPEQNGTIVSSGLMVYAIEDDCGTPVEEVSLSEGQVIASSLVDGAEYVVYFMVKHDGDVQKLHIPGRVRLNAYKIYGRTLVKDEGDKDHDARMIVYKATPQPQVDFSFSNSGDPGTMTLTFDLAADKDDNVLDMVFMDESED